MVLLDIRKTQQRLCSLQHCAAKKDNHLRDLFTRPLKFLLPAFEAKALPMVRLEDLDLRAARGRFLRLAFCLLLLPPDFCFLRPVADPYSFPTRPAASRHQHQQPDRHPGTGRHNLQRACKLMPLQNSSSNVPWTFELTYGRT